jgi:alkylation response protein AidB-like acyl-CoA dehydrogenase
MKISFSAEDEAYRQRLRDWLQQKSDLISRTLKGLDESGARNPLMASRAWQRELYNAGYVGLSWPKAYGGYEATLTQQVIVNEELARSNAPGLINSIGLTIVAPTLIKHGTEAQKSRYLKRILTAEDLWCQCFSEPGAGSDLASLRTSATLEGDEFLVNGQKVWTSLGPIADLGVLLVRTDRTRPKREGITYLIVDMKSPGLEVRPLRNAGGGSHFSEVFFTDVRVPVSNLVGEINRGWEVTRSTLDNERSGLSGVVALERSLERLIERAKLDAALAGDAFVREALARHWIAIEGLRFLGYRNLGAQLHGKDPGPQASVGKLFASIVRQGMAKTALDLAGPYAGLSKRSPHVIERGRLVAGYFDSLGYSIGGGTSEIMHNVIAERVLGLPRSVEE